jgi:hypothetical protein
MTAIEVKGGAGTRAWTRAVASVCAAASLATDATGGSLTLGTGVDYSTGKYGSATSTEVLYVPFYARAEAGRWLFRVTVPQVNISSQGRVTIVDGRPVVVADTRAPRTTVSGMGDSVAAVGYTILDGQRTGLILDLYGKVKFPTGDSSRGLGTGEYDYAAQADMVKSLGRYSLLGTVGSRCLGNPPGVEYRDVWYGSAGLAVRLDAHQSAGLIYDYRQASTARGFQQSEFMAFFSRRITPELKLQIYGIRGLSDGSPEWAGGVMLSRRF